MGLSRARQAGLELGLLSGEDSVLIDRFASKLGIPLVFKGCKDKGAALQDFCRTIAARAHHVHGRRCQRSSRARDRGLERCTGQRTTSRKDEGLDGHGARRQGAVRMLIEMILAAQTKYAKAGAG